MKKHLLLLFLLGFVVLAQAQIMTVMTFNIRYDNPDDKYTWESRKLPLSWFVREAAPDIIGFQEALRHQVDDLQGLMPEYYYFGVGRDDGEEKGEFAPIFYRKDRWLLLESETIWLSDDPYEVGSIGWDAELPRIATECRFKHIATGREVMIINTHFDHIGEEAREESARLLRNRIQFMDNNLPVVLMGDFNFDENSNAYFALVNGGIKDVQKDLFRWVFTLWHLQWI